MFGASDDELLWIQCDRCKLWWDFQCAGIKDGNSTPDDFIASCVIKDISDVFYCELFRMVRVF